MTAPRCLCGCGTEIRPGTTWKRGHSSKRPKLMTPARLAALNKVCEANRVPVDVRFGRFIGEQTSTGCIEWTGSKDGKGYGRIVIGRVNRAATHVALELAGRPRPSPDLYALHRCDNPGCVNPEHLWWGTQAENIRDCWEKGRAFEGGLRLGREIRFEQLKQAREAKPFAAVTRDIMLRCVRNEPDPAERKHRIMIMREDGHLSDEEAEFYISAWGLAAA